MLKQKKWRCEVCDFDNVDELTSCEMCESPKKKELKVVEPHSERELIEKQPGIICPNKACNHYNSLLQNRCTLCKSSLFGDKSFHKPYHSKEQSQLEAKFKYCYKCRFQNDSMNKTCVGCDADLLQKKFPNNSMVGPFGGMIPKANKHRQYYCEDCGGKVELLDANKVIFGYPVTYYDYICRKCSKKNISEEKLCIFCDKHLTKQESQFHNDICQARAAFFKREGNPTFDRCSRLQVQAVLYMHKKCQEFHELNKEMLIYKIKKLGYNQKDLQNLHHYIMHYAPIIIHMRVNNHFQYFIKDTHYRNCFEVHGNNAGRVQWEDRMFDGKHHRASFYQRVKYGTMNFTNDPHGVNACVGYGQSYFLLKPHVRDRCTITDMDSASPTATIGTFRFVFHVLMKLSDAELKAAFEGSKGKEMLSNVIGAYKQIQIHGPVEFKKDIERVYLCRQQFVLDHQNLENLAKEFCQKNNLQYEFFDRKPVNHIGLFGGVNNKINVQKAPERILGDKEKDLNLDESQIAQSGIFGGYKLGKPIKKSARKR